ncbi:hypothetical protein A0H81_10406 [Grifola frondosa]|uniref:Uncharacterized protein n=1 Tax=Grifola frondosa TaxID=5627 RepID=A0A1C7LYL0_GRIFR|nr:hypothetical protein A0H81_10406 [Grifola frondosa]
MTQVLLFIQMCLGSPKFLRSQIPTDHQDGDGAQGGGPGACSRESARCAVVATGGKALRFPRRTRLTSFDDLRLGEESPDREHGQFRLRPDMIRRMNDAPKLVDPSGWISEGQSESGGRARDDGRLGPQKSSVRGAGASGASVESSTRDGGEIEVSVDTRTQTVEFTSTPHPNRELNAVDRTSVDDQTDESGDRDGEVRQHVSSDRRCFVDRRCRYHGQRRRRRHAAVGETDTTQRVRWISHATCDYFEKMLTFLCDDWLQS